MSPLFLFLQVVLMFLEVVGKILNGVVRHLIGNLNQSLGQDGDDVVSQILSQRLGFDVELRLLQSHQILKLLGFLLLSCQPCCFLLFLPGLLLLLL